MLGVRVIEFAKVVVARLNLRIVFTGVRPGSKSKSALRCCLRKIDKIAYSILLGVISLSVNLKSRDFDQYLVWFRSEFLILARY